MIVVFRRKNSSRQSDWKVKKYEKKMSETCWTSENAWASDLSDDFKSMNEFLLKMTVANEDVFAFDDSWLKKMGIEDLDDESWPEYVELDMLQKVEKA